MREFDHELVEQKTSQLRRWLMLSTVLNAILLGLLVFQSAPSIANSLVSLPRAVDGNEFAVRELHPEKFSKADREDASVQNTIGWYYISAPRLSRDYSLAKIWFEKSANQGNTQSQFMVGRLNLLGYGTPKDYKSALIWFNRAAEGGSGSAMYQIGYMHHHGKGVQLDFKKAKNWYEKAKELNTRKAFYGLGQLYENGHGVVRSYARAIELYEDAALLNYADAYYAIGRFHERGLGVPKNPERAKHYYKEAAKRQNKKAEEALKSL